MVTRLIGFLVFLAGVSVSCNYADGYWVVGPVFGLVVAAWDSDFLRGFSPIRHPAFIAASTLIYALVFHIASQNWLQGSDLAESLYGPFPVAVLVGSTLLPFAHKFILKASDKLVTQTIPLLIFSYYLTAFASFANDNWKIGLDFNFAFVAIAVWQGAYLYFMFPEKKK